MSPPRRAYHSGWVAYAVLFWGAVLFEYLTFPWKTGRIIPTPYTMLYALATVACALRGYAPGLVCSLSWYFGALAVDSIWARNPVTLDVYQGLRFALQVAGPWFISRQVAKRRFAERQVAAVLEVLASGIPHKLNNRLMVVMCNASDLRETLPLSEQQTQVAEILEAAQESADLVRSVQRYARQGLVAPQLLDVTELIQAIKPEGESRGNNTRSTAETRSTFPLLR